MKIYIFLSFLSDNQQFLHNFTFLNFDTISEFDSIFKIIYCCFENLIGDVKLVVVFENFEKLLTFFKHFLFVHWDVKVEDKHMKYIVLLPQYLIKASFLGPHIIYKSLHISFFSHCFILSISSKLYIYIYKYENRGCWMLHKSKSKSFSVNFKILFKFQLLLEVKWSF